MRRHYKLSSIKTPNIGNDLPVTFSCGGLMSFIPVPDANSAWFTFLSQEADFAVYSFKGSEEVHKPYVFEIELVSRKSAIDINALIGTSATLMITDRSGGTRPVNGIIMEMQQLHTANLFTHYKCILVPRLWFLGLRQDHRIFQDMTVADIIELILKEHGFTAEQMVLALAKAYQPREYCVMYGETYLHFLSRLCEEEGIYYYFSHLKDDHCLCFSDHAGGPRIEGESRLRFFPGSGQAADTAVIAKLKYFNTAKSNKATYKDWNFTKPKFDLTVHEQESEYTKAPRPKGMSLEMYRYPHIYQQKTEGQRYTDIQLSRYLALGRRIECESDVSRFAPAYTFDMHSHQRAELNQVWWTVSVRHEGEQPTVLEHEAPSDRGMHYRSYILAIPEEIRFVPAEEHPKNRVWGSQTALVTGPKGEEIYPDEHGRVKVQFHWDRLGQYNENTTCWIRVSQGWAGSDYGMMAIPRIGHEVVVSFLEGDPDRPLITGRVYNGANKPPYSLPEHKTRMVLRSKTHQGEGYNELRFEDLQSNEQIYVHGQRDLDVIIENDAKHWVKNDRHEYIGRDSVQEIKGIGSSQVDKDRSEGTGGKRSVTVAGDASNQVGGSWHQKVNGNVYIQGAKSGVFEMDEEITIKAPGGFIRIDASGVTIDGKVVNINSGGSPGVGFPVQSIPARSAEFADSRDAISGQKSELPPAPTPPEAVSDEPEVTTFAGSGYVASPAGPEVAQGLAGLTLPIAAMVPSFIKGGLGEVEALKLSETPVSQEWGKTVLDAAQEKSVAGKLQVTDNFFQRNVACVEQYGENLKGMSGLLDSGVGNSLEISVAKYQTLAQAGVPQESMKILSTSQGNMLAVKDGAQTLVASPGMLPVRDSAALSVVEAPAAAFDSTGALAFTTV